MEVRAGDRLNPWRLGGLRHPGASRRPYSLGKDALAFRRTRTRLAHWLSAVACLSLLRTQTGPRPGRGRPYGEVRRGDGDMSPRRNIEFSDQYARAREARHDEFCKAVTRGYSEGGRERAATRRIKKRKNSASVGISGAVRAGARGWAFEKQSWNSTAAGISSAVRARARALTKVLENSAVGYVRAEKRKHAWLSLGNFARHSWSERRASKVGRNRQLRWRPG